MDSNKNANQIRKRGRPVGRNFHLRTTIPANLGRRLELKAAEEFATVNEIVTALIQKGLDDES